MTRPTNKQENIFEGAQKVVFDAENNRVRYQTEHRVFQETDHEVKIYDFSLMRLLVSDPLKKMCVMRKLNDISPVSMVPRDNDHIIITDAI